MTPEQKEIILLGARFEILNKHIDLYYLYDRDGEFDHDHANLRIEKVAAAMQEYAELYLIAKTKEQ
jgi:hypothetical protein